jgi:gamma-glutamylcyclotransferase (GGCT)/AIG2-like uncharacterized protein YtfP
MPDNAMTKSHNPLPLFAYGTLQDAEILAAVLGRHMPPRAFTPARVQDFASLYYPGRVYPALVSRPGAAAEGLLIAGLRLSDHQALDAFEGDEYRRETLSVQTAQGTVLAACYLPAQPVPPDSPPWRLEDWHRLHRPGHIATEKSLAAAARLGPGKRD